MYKNDVPSHLFRACCMVFAVVIAPVGRSFRAGAQTPPADLSFEVATVKQVDPSVRFNPMHHWAHVTPAGASYWSMSPVALITYAYGVESFQVTAPEWASHDRFDIEARFPEGADKKDDRRMLQALLEDRFKLAFHTEKQDLEGYVLVVGKHGAKLRASLADPVSPEVGAPLKAEDNKAGEAPAKSRVTRNPDGSSTVDMGTRGTQTIKYDPEISAMHYQRSKMTMEELAEYLRNCLGGGDHKIVDETGIEGTYQVQYDCPTPTVQRSSGGTDAAGMLPSDPQGESALTRSLDALGLKLEKRKMLQEVYVIDHVERPSAN